MLAEINGHTLIDTGLSRESVILDLGANRGKFAHQMIATYGCRVHAVEANPTLIQTIQPHPNLTVHHLAITGQNGPVTLRIDANPEASTILDTNGTTGVQVQGITLPALLERERITRVALIKFDIEGSEIAALDACSDAFLQSIPQVTIEFHDFVQLTPVSTIERVVNRLEALGFVTLKMWRSAWGDTLLVNRALVDVSGLQLQYWKRVTTNWRRVSKAGARLVGVHA